MSRRSERLAKLAQYECACCFEETIKASVSCDCCRVRFCGSCVERYCQARLAAMRIDMVCFAPASECNEKLQPRMLQAVLSKETGVWYKKVKSALHRQQDAPDVVIVPNQAAEVMTRALVRECPTCRTELMKEGGCNKLKCPRCETLMCHVCRERVTDVFAHYAPFGTLSYGHCRLYDDSDRRVALEVVEAVRRVLPDVPVNVPEPQNVKVVPPHIIAWFQRASWVIIESVDEIKREFHAFLNMPEQDDIGRSRMVDLERLFGVQKDLILLVRQVHNLVYNPEPVDETLLASFLLGSMRRVKQVAAQGDLILPRDMM